tara:strand:+ start:315 stop:578 length:264 start_codon:yes stop_codon:yes gene_type:complete
VQVVLRVVDIISLFAVVRYYIETKNEAKNAEESAYNNDKSIKFGEGDSTFFKKVAYASKELPEEEPSYQYVAPTDTDTNVEDLDKDK